MATAESRAKAALLQAKLDEELAQVAEADEKIQRRAEYPTYTTPRKDWIRMNQQERNELVAACESATYEAFGCFPKANWMV